MPLNSIPATTTRAGLEAKREAAEGKLSVDVGFWGGVVPGNTGELRALWEAGVLGFKCFMAPSGVPEFGHVGEAELREAMPVLAELGAPLLVHAEAPGPLERATADVATLDPRRYATYLRSRPGAAEIEAIELLVRLCREYGTRIHVVHLATAQAVPLLRRAKDEGLPVTVETCPHYLHFAAEEIADGATELKCAPPIRRLANREGLWNALRDGVIDLVASDHSPAPPEMKQVGGGDFLRAWGGIPSLQLTLSVVWRGARARGYTAAQVAEWMCAAPARLAGLQGRKGAIAPGADADLVAWDPGAELTVEPHLLHQRHQFSPYAGLRLPGVVLGTWLRGERIHDGAALSPPSGRTLQRTPTA